VEPTRDQLRKRKEIIKELKFSTFTYEEVGLIHFEGKPDVS